jgi:hypothetical protein
MKMQVFTPSRAAGLACVALVTLVGTGSATDSSKDRCVGSYSAAELEGFLPRARLALSLPSTESVALESGAGCIRIAVRSVGTKRLVGLILRGVAVPRAAVQLDVLPQTSTART